MVKQTITLDQAVEGFLLTKRAEGRSSHTLEQYHWACAKLNALCGDTPLPEISPDHVRHLLVEVRALSDKSRRNLLLALSSLWTWAIDEGYAHEHIIQRIEMPRDQPPDIEPFTQAELRRLLKACDQTASYGGTWRHPAGTTNQRPTALRDRAILIFLLDTGVRASELCALTVTDVNMENQTATIRSGKGNKPRVIHFAKRCHQALWRYHVTRQPHLDPKQPLFHTGPADLPGAFERRVLARLLKRIGERAGVHPANPHRFRHTFAIEFLRNGGNLFALQDLLGHSNLVMSRRYARIVDADRAHAHRLASPVDNWRL